MSKIRLLVLPSDKSGVGKFRSLDPHIYLQNKYSEDFHVDIDYEPKIDDDTYWKKYDVVHFHRSIGRDYPKSVKIIQKLNSMGIVTIMDLDDYWLPTIDHPIYTLVKENKVDFYIKENLKYSNYVITTTDIFANEIRKINKNVFVLPNAIDPNEPQFKQPTIESDKLRFGWLGGSSHLRDLELLKGTFGKLSNLRDKFELYLCGFDVRGSVTEINQKTKEQKRRDITPSETVWARYEEIFTNNYSLVSEDYKKHLLTFKPDRYPNEDFYHRVWTEPVNTYAKNYANFDVSLAPIKDHIFNRAKSQLKVIEAGFYKKAIIASDIGPYTIDLTHSIKNGIFGEGNAILIDKNRNHSDWTKYIKKLIENPNLAKDLGERLYETVKDKYSLDAVTKTRQEIYKQITS